MTVELGESQPNQVQKGLSIYCKTKMGQQFWSRDILSDILRIENFLSLDRKLITQVSPT
jgi:hypothetical protein